MTTPRTRFIRDGANPRAICQSPRTTISDPSTAPAATGETVMFGRWMRAPSEREKTASRESAARPQMKTQTRPAATIDTPEISRARRDNGRSTTSG